MTHDVIVVGGSYAGSAAALQIVRARRRVLVIDAGRRRNRFAAHSHGFVGQDGADPAEIARTARADVSAYPTLTWVEGTATAAERTDDGFAVTLGDGTRHDGRRLILAPGVSDTLPDIPGLAERWGRGVFHCPYCHGYELGGGHIGLIATMPAMLNHAPLFTEWGRVTLLLDPAIQPDAATRAELDRRGIGIETTPIAAIEGDATIRLADGRELAFAGLFAAPRTQPASALAEILGCALEETPQGIQIATDGMKATSVPGVFSCGDAARAMHSLSLAVGDGALAGAATHRSLVFPG